MSSTTGEADKLSSLTSAQSCHHFSLAEIQSATNDFDDKLVIGKGGFGKVYKGRICVEETNLVVAIKRLNSMSDQGAPEFRTEIEILSKLRHCHLVSLIGFCHDNKEMILVYEYMPHGTLYDHLHKADTPLTWVQRLKIAIGAGRGLDYLHTGVGTQHGVIHRDVKSSNILLDENLAARISDFGLSKVAPTNQSSSYVDASVKGTFGYLDPEYFYTRKLTRKTDVFAFGVLLFELLSGRRAVDERFGEEQCSLVRWAQKCVKDRKLDQMVDSSIRGMILPKCLRRFAQIADRCLYSVPKERPTMTEVVASLQVLLELQRKNDDSGESSGSMGFTWKIHEYLVPTTKQHSDNVRNMRARMRQLDGTSIDVMKHKDRNDMNAREVPDRVPSWLEEVATIKRQVESISSNDNKRSNMIVRYQVGRDALKTTLEIERLLKEGREISWLDDFKSREMIFEVALMFLQQDDKTQVIALCGMGGVGKTTMMEQLKKVAKDKHMFDWIVEVVLGKQPETFFIQTVVAKNLSHSLTEVIRETRAECLRKIIEEILRKDKKGILVILDDVRGKFELKDVGLSPLPNGVKLLLTSRYEDICTSFAVQANVHDLEVLKVGVLEETEAHKFFCQISGVSEEHDPELYEIGGKIVKKCSYLPPLAIKLIASTLNSESKSAIWRHRLRCLQMNGPDQDVHEIINISYNYLKEEDKEIFLLCGLFPEDSNIRIEDLTRYAWGLQLLDGVSTLEDARDRTEACVSHLKNAHLLIDNDDPRYVKLHDLVLDFVLATVSKGDRASLIKHGDVSTWSPVEMSESYRRISLSCKGLPEGFKSPNLSLLKLMNGDGSFGFPEDFYGNTEKLEVMAYEKFRYPWLSRLLQCSTNLRTLCLHQCTLMFDCSFIGNLVNLEVLSFSDSFLCELPSSAGNLKKLKLLDLTGCFGVKINDGVLKNLVKLEEIYMRDIKFTERNINELAGRSKNLLALEIGCFENKGQLKKMSYENLKRFKINMGDFDNYRKYKLKLFGNKLSLVTNKDELLESGMNGLLEKTEELCLEVDSMTNLEDIEVKSLHSPQHSSFCNLRSLMVSKCAELRYIFTLRVATALSKLEHLDISVCKSMQELIHIESSEPKRIEFPNLKFLSLDELPKLLSLCNTINVIELPQLMDLGLYRLPNFTSIYPKKKLATSSMAINDSAWRPFLNEEFSQEDITSWSFCQYSRKIDLFWCHALSSAIPFDAAGQTQKLEELTIKYCHSLVEVFETQRNFDEGSDTTLAIPRPKNINVPQLSNLKKLNIKGCHLLQYVFTFATLESLRQLHELKIEECRAMKVIVKEETDQEQTTPPSQVVVFRRLKSIALVNLPTLTGFFLGMNDFQWPFLDEVKIDACPQMTVFTRGCSKAPKVNINIRTNFGKYSLDSPGLNFPQTPCSSLDGTGDSYHTTSEGIIRWPFNNLIEIDVKYDDVEQIIPSKELLQVQKLERIHVEHCGYVKEVFEALDDSGYSELPLVVKIPKLREVDLRWVYGLKYIWKSNPWMVLEFPNLTKVYIYYCRSLEHVFSSSMVGSLLQLQHLYIYECGHMEVIVKGTQEEEEEEEGDDAKVNDEIIMLPRLKSLILYSLPSLKGFYLGKEAFSWPSLDTLEIKGCPAMTVFTKGDSVTPKLRVIDTKFGRCELDQLNSFIKNKQEEGLFK